MLEGYTNVSYNNLNFSAAHRPTRIILEQTRLPRAVKKQSLDLLWSPGYTAPFYASCPQVVTVCDLQYKSYPEDMSTIERQTLDFLVKGACRRCDGVLAISEFSRQEIIGYNFASPDKVYTVLLGVDRSFGIPISEGERNQLLQDLIPFQSPYILCVAHTYPHKKVHVLIEAFSDVMDKLPHNLVIVGKARRGEGLVQEALKRVNDRKRLIRFQDGVPYRHLQGLFQAADIFVLPSVYEGFGLPVVEAMMAGVPVVTTRLASLKEVAGAHAFSVDSITSQSFAEKLLEVYALDQRTRHTHLDEAKRWAESFTWKRSVDKMFDVFQSVINSSKY
jgi:glycosyltransferase involved in cell wall biosynthesis